MPAAAMFDAIADAPRLGLPGNDFIYPIMSQAVLGIAAACRDPRRAVAVAATYVAGFRIALAAEPLRAVFAPPDVAMSVADALDGAPWAAAAAAWHTPRAGRAELVTELATRAAVHRDAHLVKYTLACLDAAAWDRTQDSLYLAAAAKLHSYWVRHGDPGDPLTTGD